MKHTVHIVLDERNEWLGTHVHLSQAAASRWIQDTGFNRGQTPIVEAQLTYGQDLLSLKYAMKHLIKKIDAKPKRKRVVKNKRGVK